MHDKTQDALRRRSTRPTPPLLPAGGGRHQAGACARDAACGGLRRGDFDKPQVGIASTWSNLTPCNMHIDELARLAAAGRRGAWRQGGDLQHHHRFRRHLDGHARDALFAGIARGDRRFDRDRGRRAGLRRRGGIRRLRQEHARMHDGARAPRSSGGLRLRRHHPPGRRPARHRVGVRGGRRSRAGHRVGGSSSSSSSARRFPGPAPARECTRPIPWPRPSRRWA